MRRAGVRVLFLAVVGGACGDAERVVTDDSGLVLRLPSGWVDTPVAHGTSWSGPRGSEEWRTTLNVHAVPMRSDEVLRSEEAVARAVAVQARHMERANARLSRGPRVAGRGSWQVELRFDHQGTRYRRRQYVVRHGDDIVNLDATAPESRWSDLEPVLARALETARWEGRR